MGGLGDDFAGGEVAGVAHLAGGAEDAAHGAADLAGDASGHAAGETHENGFDAFGVAERKEIFAREAVGGVRGGGDGKGADVGFGGEAVADARGQVGHRVDGVDEVEIEIGPDSGGVGGVEVALDQPRAEVGTGEVVEVGGRGRRHVGAGDGSAGKGEEQDRGEVRGGSGDCPRNTRKPRKTGASLRVWRGDFVRVASRVSCGEGWGFARGGIGRRRGARARIECGGQERWRRRERVLNGPGRWAKNGIEPARRGGVGRGMALQVIPILKAVAPLIAQAGGIVAGMRSTRETTRMEDRVSKIEQETLRAGEVLTTVAQQLQAIAQELKRQAEVTERLQRRAWTMMIVAGAALVVAGVALVVVVAR